MAKKIFAVETYVDHDSIEYIDFESERGLLDAEIILYTPRLPEGTQNVGRQLYPKGCLLE